MSGKSEKKLKRLVLKQYRVNYEEFLQIVATVGFMDRAAICWTVQWGKDGLRGFVRSGFSRLLRIIRMPGLYRGEWKHIKQSLSDQEITPDVLTGLEKAGLKTFDTIKQAGVKGLLLIKGIGYPTAYKILGVVIGEGAAPTLSVNKEENKQQEDEG